MYSTPCMKDASCASYGKGRFQSSRTQMWKLFVSCGLGFQFYLVLYCGLIIWAKLRIGPNTHFQWNVAKAPAELRGATAIRNSYVWGICCSISWMKPAERIIHHSWIITIHRSCFPFFCMDFMSRSTSLLHTHATRGSLLTTWSSVPEFVIWFCFYDNDLAVSFALRLNICIHTSTCTLPTNNKLAPRPWPCPAKDRWLHCATLELTAGAASPGQHHRGVQMGGPHRGLGPAFEGAGARGGSRLAAVRRGPKPLAQPWPQVPRRVPALPHGARSVARVPRPAAHLVSWPGNVLLWLGRGREFSHVFGCEDDANVNYASKFQIIAKE